MIRCRRPLFVLPLFLTLLIAAPPALAGDAVGEPLDLKRDEMLQHRRQEAATKAKLTKALIAAEAAATPNQALYDVHYYDLDLDLDPSSHILTGTCLTAAEVTAGPVTTMDLDLRYNMTILAARVGGTTVTTSRVGDVMTVNLDRAYATGETVEVAVDYSGNPASSYFGWDSYNGQDMIWTLSEPYGARFWWPCKDLNSDKADSVSIRCTVPSGLVVASNGLLQSDVTAGDRRTFHWKTNYPIPTYLVSLAIYPYTQFSDWYTPQAGGDAMEVQFFVYPDHYSAVQATYALTVPMIDQFAQGYGEYPFVNEKYGHAEFTWGGGMEHQTITSLGGWSEDLISHELAHQWWGDMVTCEDFGHIWLNEGFATWSEAYWAEQQYGVDTYQTYMDYAAYYGAGTIFVEDPNDFNAIFDSNLSYNKGSWVVHMLRGVLGDADFFAGLALYRANHEYGTATTEQLRDVMETVSGKDLDAFFQQWIYGEYFPVYEMSWVDSAAPGEILVTIDQVQTNTGLFTMPIQLRVTTDAGTIDVTVQNSQAGETYPIAVPGAVQSVQLDPENWILHQIQTVVTNPSLDRGILLVNGVHWATYSTEITSAYADSVFWGDNPITFWDCFDEPAGGYPANLPVPLGHGVVPADVLGDYSTVVWVGNNYNGDLATWQQTPIRSYLEAGGNVLLMSRRSAYFFDEALTAYLGVTWQEADATLANCIAVHPQLVDIPFTSSQSWNDVYATTVDPGTELLFEDTAAFSGPRGTGAFVAPAGGGTNRIDGGRFAHIGGRPYRMDHAALRQNVETVLSDLMLEPYDSGSPVDQGPVAVAAAPALGRNYPNPFNPQTVIPFSLPQATDVALTIYDVRGRQVRLLVDGSYPRGDHRARWNGMDDAGQGVSSGTYFVRMTTADGVVATRNLVLVR